MKTNFQKDIDSGNIIYVSDPSSLASRYLPDPATEESLRELINEMASAGVDLFIQEAYTQLTGVLRDLTTTLDPSIVVFYPYLTKGNNRSKSCWISATNITSVSLRVFV